MLPNVRPRPNAHLYYNKKVIGPVAKAPPKFTIEDWDFSNKVKLRIALDQQRLVDRVHEEAARIIDEVTETTKEWQKEVEHHMGERVTEIRFLCDELNKQKRTAMLEEEALTTYRNRVNNSIEFLKEKSLSICKQCIVWRESRIGVDFCDDEVDRELCRELKIIKGCQELMDRTMKETVEQIRKLRAALVLLDEDLSQKEKSLLIDVKNTKLKEFQEDLGQGQDLTANICLYTLNQWEQQTYRNLESNARELNSASQLRAYIDLLLKQVCEDLRNQTERTNQAFERRIDEIKFAKAGLEIRHTETMSRIMDVQQNITLLQTEIGKQDRAMLLCKTRLSNRATRPGLELTCDIVQDSLYLELSALQATMCKLNQKIIENKALMRYLMQVQMVQEEEINVKANAIKIDEVDCMTLRIALSYTVF